MANVVWVALPLLLYAAFVVGRHLTRRALGKRALELHLSLMLMAYLLGTMGLGIFWVASQQLPVFDLHYLFGYASLLLVAVHLSFTLPRAWRQLWRRDKAKAPAKAPAEARLSRRWVLGGLAAAAALGLSFVLGMRHGKSELGMLWDAQAATDAGPVALLVRYHEQSSLSRLGVFARAPNIDWGPEPARFKKHPGSQRLALPRPTWDGAGRGLSEALRGPDHVSGRLSLEALAGILHHAAGITEVRGGHPLRAAPSSGALFPTEIYVGVEQIEGLPPGLYHYDPEDHALERLGTASAEALAAAPLPPAPASLILTLMLRRSGYKYGHRAYRYAVADAGHLLENVRIAAAEAGLSASPLARFDEARVATALGLGGVEEAVVALVPLSAVPTPPLGPHHHAAPPPASASRGLGPSAMAHVATSLRLADAGADGVLSPLPPAELVGAGEPAESALALVRARRSERRYQDEPLALGALSTVLADAAQPPLLSTAVRLHLLVRRVDGLAAGVHRYHPTSHALELVRPGDPSAAARSAALSQDVIGDAAVVIVLTADRDQVFARDGARGYRHTFLEMGMIGERLLLGAAAKGWGACPVGAFYDDDMASLLGVDLEREWVLHLVALGAL